jgi:hypothetical protein
MKRIEVTIFAENLKTGEVIGQNKAGALPSKTTQSFILEGESDEELFTKLFMNTLGVYVAASVGDTSSDKFKDKLVAYYEKYKKIVNE